MRAVAHVVVISTAPSPNSGPSVIVTAFDLSGANLRRSKARFPRRPVSLADIWNKVGKV
jgi:hypothetical protein